jgi:hypothetical protein
MGEKFSALKYNSSENQSILAPLGEMSAQLTEGAQQPKQNFLEEIQHRSKRGSYTKTSLIILNFKKIKKILNFYLPDFLSLKNYFIIILNIFSTMYCMVYVFIYIFAMSCYMY